MFKEKNSYSRSGMFSAMQLTFFFFNKQIRISNVLVEISASQKEGN